MTADSPIHDEVAVLLRRADQRYTTGRRRLVDALLAEHGPEEFAERFLRDAGLDWAADLLARFPAPQPQPPKET